MSYSVYPNNSSINHIQNEPKMRFPHDTAPTTKLISQLPAEIHYRV